MEPLIGLALLLFGAKMGGILFSKLKQPSLAGELLAGVILGPTILNLVTLSPLINTVSQLGLLFLILLVSLSIDWKVLEGNTEKYIFIEIFRVILTLGAVYVLGMFFAWDTFMFLIMGFIVILSSTAIASRALADMREVGSSEGQALLGLEVVDEVVAIIVVAILANFLSGAAFTIEPLITTVLIVVGLFVVMSRVGYKFINRLIHTIQKYGIEEAMLAFTLLLAFLLGSLTEGLHLASILGVFIAGMILSKSSQYVVITRKVKDIGEGFFIPIFFAAVGLSINLFAAASDLNFFLMIIGSILGIKLVTTFVALKTFGFSGKESFKIGTGFVTLSEMTIVIVALAVTKLSPAIQAVIIGSFIIVNAVSPLLMNFAFKNQGIYKSLSGMPKVSPQRKWHGSYRLPVNHSENIRPRRWSPMKT